MSLVTFPRQFLVDANGTPRVGAKVHFYQAGTTTAITTYTTPAFSTEHENPVKSVAGGLFPAVYINPGVNSTFKMVITDSDDVTIYSEDNISALGPAAEPRYDQTAAEVAAGVTPVDYSYLPGDVRRYGAVLDDSTDCLTALRAAAAVCLAAGGGEIYIPGKARTSDTIYITSNTRVYGDGFHCSVKPTASTASFDTESIFMALRDYAGGGEDSDPSGGDFSDYYGPHENITIEDLYLEGVDPFETGVSASRGSSTVHVQMCDGVNIRRLWVNGASDACIRVDGYGSGAFTSDASDAFWANTTDAYIQDCFCEAGFIGIELEGLVTRAWVMNNTVSGCARSLRNASSIEAEWAGNNVKDAVEDTIESSTIGMHMSKMKRGKVHHNTIDMGDPDFIAVNYQNAEDTECENNLIVEGHVFMANLSPTPEGFQTTSVRNKFRHNTLLTDGTTYTPDSANNVAINVRVGTDWDISNNILPNDGTIYVRSSANGGTASGKLFGNIATVDNNRPTNVIEAFTQRPSDFRVENNGTRYSSGANGHTVLHPDGTKECWHLLEVSVSASANGSATWTFQTGSGAFTETPIVTATVSSNSNYYATVGTGDATSIPVTVTHHEDTSDTATVNVMVRAIGRWK